MDSVRIHNIAVDNVKLRKWPAHCSKDAFAKPRPRSFSSGMKFGLNLEPSSHGNSNCLELDLADLSRSVSFPKISSKQMYLVSANGVANINATEEQNGDSPNGSKRGSCPNLSKITKEGICLPTLNNVTAESSELQQDSHAMCSREDVQTDIVFQQSSEQGMSEVNTYSNTSNASEYCISTKQECFRSTKKLERSQSVEELRERKPSSSSQVSDNATHASLEKQSTIDAFVQGKYCSCPLLVPSQHMSGAIEACIDLGREEFHSHHSSSKNSSFQEEHDNVAHTDSGTITDGNVSSSSAVNLTNLGRSMSMSKLTKRGSLIDDRQMSRLPEETVTAPKLERCDSWPCISPKNPLHLTHIRPVVLVEDATVIERFENHDKCVEGDSETMSCNDSIKSSGTEDLKSAMKTTKKAKQPSKGLSKALVKGVKSGVNSQSQSSSLASLSSTGTNDSHGPLRKGTRPKPGIQTKKLTTKAQRDTAGGDRLQRKGVKNTENLDNARIKPGIVKRNTVSTLQQFKLDFSKSSRPSVNHRPGSTLSEPDQARKRPSDLSHRLATSPNSKLPMIRRISQAASATPKATTRPDKSQTKGVTTPSRPTGPASIKRVGSFSLVEKQKQVLSSGSSPNLLRNSSIKRKVSAPVVNTAQRSAANRPGSGTLTRFKPSITRPATADKKKISETTTTVVPSRQKPTPSSHTTKQSTKPPIPSSRAHHPSRLPRKVSRDPSTESVHSHDWDYESTTSDYDNRRLSRQDSYPTDYDADRSDLESSTRSWHSPQAPDILTGVTRESRSRSVEVQVEIDDDKAVQDMHDKMERLDQLLAGKSKQCRALEGRIADGDAAFIASAMLLAIFNKQLRAGSRHITQMSRDLEMIEEDLRHNKERLREEEGNSVKLQEEMMYVRSEHKVAIETLKADHENDVEALSFTMKRQQMDELTIAAREHVEELGRLRQQHENQLLELRKSHAKAIADLHEQYKDEIVEIESKHSSHVDELLEEHQVEVENIKSDYEEQRSSLEKKLFSVTSECTSLNIKLQRLQEETEKDIEYRIQDAIEKYKSLPEELESMKAVLEMKNDEIKQLRKERMETTMELDHLRKLITRLKKLEHENESLSFVVESKSKFERQLSVERETLKTHLEKESAKSKRLSLENEELQWRLFNSPSPGSEPLESPKPNSRNSFRLSASFSDAETIAECE